jgi:hypothetical protein
MIRCAALPVASVVVALAMTVQAAQQTAQQTAAPQRRNDTRTWYQAYGDAQRDVQQGRWQAAIDDVQAALRLGAPRPGRNVLFYGDVYRDFNPDYYVGVASLNLKQYDAADKAFERVRQANLIGARDADYANFTRQAALAKFEVLMAQAQQSLAQNRIDEAEAIAKNAGALGVDDKRVSAFNLDIGAARQKKDAASVTASAGNAGSTGGAIPAPGSGATGGSASPPPTAGGAAAVPIQTATAATNLGTLPGSAQPPGRQNNAPPQQGGQASTRPPVNAGLPNPVNPKPFRQLAPVGNDRTAEQVRTAIVKFFSGEYETAANDLAPIAASAGASPRVFFYLACSRAALVLTGRANASALDEARRELALAGDTSGLAADKTLVSPRIRQALGIR